MPRSDCFDLLTKRGKGLSLSLRKSRQNFTLSTLAAIAICQYGTDFDRPSSETATPSMQELCAIKLSIWSYSLASRGLYQTGTKYCPKTRLRSRNFTGLGIYPTTKMTTPPEDGIERKAASTTYIVRIGQSPRSRFCAYSLIATLCYEPKA